MRLQMFNNTCIAVTFNRGNTAKFRLFIALESSRDLPDSMEQTMLMELRKTTQASLTNDAFVQSSLLVHSTGNFVELHLS